MEMIKQVPQKLHSLIQGSTFGTKVIKGGARIQASSGGEKRVCSALDIQLTDRTSQKA